MHRRQLLFGGTSLALGMSMTPRPISALSPVSSAATGIRVDVSPAATGMVRARPVAEALRRGLISLRQCEPCNIGRLRVTIVNGHEIAALSPELAVLAGLPRSPRLTRRQRHLWLTLKVVSSALSAASAARGLIVLPLAIGDAVPTVCSESASGFVGGSVNGVSLGLGRSVLSAAGIRSLPDGETASAAVCDYSAVGGLANGHPEPHDRALVMPSIFLNPPLIVAIISRISWRQLPAASQQAISALASQILAAECTHTLNGNHGSHRTFDEREAEKAYSGLKKSIETAASVITADIETSLRETRQLAHAWRVAGGA